MTRKGYLNSFLIVKKKFIITRSTSARILPLMKLCKQNENILCQLFATAHIHKEGWIICFQTPHVIMKSPAYIFLQVCLLKRTIQRADIFLFFLSFFSCYMLLLCHHVKDFRDEVEYWWNCPSCHIIWKILRFRWLTSSEITALEHIMTKITDLIHG